MTTKQDFLTNINIYRLTISLLMAITMSACSTLPPKAETPELDRTSLQADANAACQHHAQSIANHAELIASSAQYLAAAKAMSSCVSSAIQHRAYDHSTEYSNEHKADIMKMMAIATLNFIKSGDVITASREVERFKRTYPNQDLYFEDYTSFLDTATALLSLESLHSSELSALNISRVLRDEIERKHYWLNH